MKSKYLKYAVKNNTNNIKMSDKQYVKKEKNLLLSLWKKSGNKKIRGVALLNKITSQRPLCTVCTSRISTFLKQNSGSETPAIKIYG